MKVKNVIQKLQEFDPDLEIIICDEIEGNDSKLKRIEISEIPKNSSDFSQKPEKCLFMRW